MGTDSKPAPCILLGGNIKPLRVEKTELPRVDACDGAFGGVP